mmetsp:Transcript_24031/g.26689  ORF Transcript_24031/g.26689 Transcript_24031/m.26689 type:complete len:95 (+) Transcript_24031:260-544(+)
MSLYEKLDILKFNFVETERADLFIDKKNNDQIFIGFSSGSKNEGISIEINKKSYQLILGFNIKLLKKDSTYNFKITDTNASCYFNFEEFSISTS